jgi:hypothetical protein
MRFLYKGMVLVEAMFTLGENEKEEEAFLVLYFWFKFQ